MTAARALIGACTSACALACASSGPARTTAASTLVVALADDARTPAWSSPATFTVRSVAAGTPDRVVGLPGLGELHVGVGGDGDACRLVWSKDGLDRLAIYRARACADPNPTRLCFTHARFDKDGDADPAAPRALVVDGCADENDLVWSKVKGDAPATVGPSAFRQRCVKLPRHRTCDVTFLKLDAISVASNDAAATGFTLTWDGDTWRACFLERETGAYDLRVVLEDTCGRNGPLHLAGSSGDLDD